MITDVSPLMCAMCSKVQLVWWEEPEETEAVPGKAYVNGRRREQATIHGELPPT